MYGEIAVIFVSFVSFVPFVFKTCTRVYRSYLRDSIILPKVAKNSCGLVYLAPDLFCWGVCNESYLSVWFDGCEMSRHILPADPECREEGNSR